MSALVPAAAAAAAARYLGPPSHYSSIVLLLFLAGLGITLGARCLPGRPALLGAHLLVVASGLAIGIVSGVSARVASVPTLPVPSASVTALEGVAAAVTARDGGATIALRLSAAHSDRVSGSARGMASLVVDGGATIAVGARVHAVLSGPPWVGGDNVLRARAATVSARGVELPVLAETRRAISATTGSAAGLVRALLLGETESLDPRFRDLFRRAGASHVLALSGMHLAVIALLVSALVRPLAGGRVAAWCAVVVAVGYVALVGQRPSLVRASLMGILALVSREAGRPLDLLEIVSGAFLAHLLLWPTHASDVGFLLSYLSLVGLATIAPTVSSLVAPWVPQAAAMPLAAGLAAQAATAPVVLSVFGVVYPVGVITSIVLSPLVVILMCGAIVAVLLTLAGVPVALLGAAPFELIVRWCERVVWFFAGAPAFGEGPRAAAAGATGAAWAIAALLVLVSITLRLRRGRWTGRT